MTKGSGLKHGKRNAKENQGHWPLNGNVLNALRFCSVTNIPSYNRAFCQTHFISFIFPGFFMLVVGFRCCLF